MPLQNSRPGCALVLLGHGSTLNPDSSSPTWVQADEIRRRGIFDEVVCAFWKEEPGFREVFNMLDSRTVYVVPHFISEGYFTREVLPRELRLSGPTTPLGEKTVHYCDPVGIHPFMTRLLLERASEAAQGVPRDQVALIVVGHGTGLNEQSTEAIKAQVEAIRASGAGFAEVTDAYMEEAPLIADWDRLTQAPHVVVVPFFIADGLHSYEDIPVLLGLRESSPGAASAGGREVFQLNPYAVRGRTLHYTPAIGAEPLMAEAILEQVAAFERRHLQPAEAAHA